MSKEHDSNIEMADILIVDDESANLKLLSEMLGREGYRVRPANSPRLGVDSALGKPPDLMLLDIRMPDMDGFEVCNLLKQDERTRDIPILFISALQETKDKVRAFEAGGVDFISKPFQEEEVLARVQTHLKLYNMQRKLEELVAERTAELAKSEQLARLLLNATTDVTHLIDEDGTILDLNEAMAAKIGGTREELIGKCVYDFFPAEAAEVRREIVGQTLVKGKEIRFIDRHYPGMVFDVGVYPVEAPAGEKGKAVIYAQDITEREEYERKLQEREAALQQKVKQMRTILDTTPAYIFAKDIDGRFLLANKAVADVFGVDDPEQVVGKTDFDYGATEEQTRAYNMVDRSIIETQKRLLIPEEQIMRKDGTLGWFQTNKIPYQHPGYDKPAILGVAVEITERKKAEQELQKNRDYLEHLINSIPDAVFSVKLPERIIEWIRDSYNVLGHNLDEFIGKRTDRLYSSVEEYQTMGHLMETAIRDNKDGFIAEAWVRNTNGESIPAEINTTIYREKGEPVRVISLVRDISFRKKAQEALEDSETRLKQAQTETMNLRLDMAHLNRIMTMNELAASFAHEINQPLGAIVNNASVAKIVNSQPAEEREDIDEILDDIAADAQRAGQIISKIRGVMKKGDAVYTSLDVNQLLDEVVVLYQNSFNLNRITIVEEKNPDLVPVKGDKIRLQQVLMNLITNAADAMMNTPRKVLRFETSQSDGLVKVSISDTGPGLEKSVIDQIFDPFYTTKSEGMGIGLRLCRSIIEEHGGRIWAENNCDAGTTFSFTLRVFSGGQHRERT